jgi:xylose isomerase
MNEAAGLKFSTGLWVYGIVPDRYLPTGYQKNESLEEKLASVAATPGLSGVELPFGPVLKKDNLEAVRSAVGNAGLAISSLGVNVTSDSRWALGSLSNPDPEVRREIIRLVKDSLDAAAALGVDLVNLWMGQDGFDYPFEVDYRALWDRIRDGLAECAAHQPRVTLSLEYKPKEPRARNIPNSAAQALLLVNEAKAPNLGVTLDFGHSLQSGENPSQALLLLDSYRKFNHVHINDNYGDWDWDLAAGMNHWWLLVEFCHWLIELDFKGWLVLDLFPYRQTARETASLSIEAFRKAWDIASGLDREQIREGYRKHSSVAVFRQLFSR